MSRLGDTPSERQEGMMLRSADGDSTRQAVALAVIAAVAVLVRWRVAGACGVVDADESLVFLMALRIAEGRDLPPLHYGNAYLGSLDAVLAAMLFRLAGIGALAGRAVSIVLSVGVVVSAWALARRAVGREAGLRAATYVALGPGLLIVWGAKLHLGYVDLLILGNLLLLGLLGLSHAAHDPQRLLARMWWLGLIVGFGFWCHLLFLPYAIAAVAFLVAQPELRRALVRWTVLGAAAAGALVGGAPLWWYNATHGGASLAMFSRGADGGDLELVSRLGSAVFNLATVHLPVVLGTALAWQPHRAGFAVFLPGPTAALVLLTVGNVAMCVTLLVWWRIRAVRAAAGCGLTVGLGAVACLVVRTDWTVLDWIATPRDPWMPMQLVVAELIGPPVLLALVVLLPVVLLIGGAIRDRQVRWLLLAHTAASVLLLIGTSYGVIRSPRFLFPLYSVLPVVVASTSLRLDQWRRHLGATWFGLVILLQLVTHQIEPMQHSLQPVHYVADVNMPPSYGPLLERLDANDVDAVYAGYWAGLPLVFTSRERVAVSTGSVGRDAELDRRVAASERLAFLFVRDRLSHRRFQRLLRHLRIHARIEDVGPFRLYLELPVAELRQSPAWDPVTVLLAYP